jgi:transposase InsO family protein
MPLLTRSLQGSLLEAHLGKLVAEEEDLISAQQQQSVTTMADAYDNSVAESFVSTLKRELIHRHSWPRRQTARTAIFEYIEGFYNTRRRHSALGHLSPSEYEEVRLKGGAVA